MAAGKAAGRILCDPEQGRQGLLAHHPMYKDYSINESLFHWQSQSTTAENSAKGEYHEGCSRCCSRDLRRYSDET